MIITVNNLTKTEGNTSEEISKEDCLLSLGFIPNTPVRILGEWKDLNKNTNRYGRFYGEKVILTDQEHTKIMKRFNKWGGKEFTSLTQKQFMET